MISADDALKAAELMQSDWFIDCFRVALERNDFPDYSGSEATASIALSTLSIDEPSTNLEPVKLRHPKNRNPTKRKSVDFESDSIKRRSISKLAPGTEDTLALLRSNLQSLSKSELGQLLKLLCLPSETANRNASTLIECVLNPPRTDKEYTSNDMINFIRNDLQMTRIEHGSNKFLANKIQQHIPSFRNIKRKAYDETETWYSYVLEMLGWCNKSKENISPLFGIRCDAIVEELVRFRQYTTRNNTLTSYGELLLRNIEKWWSAICHDPQINGRKDVLAMKEKANNWTLHRVIPK